MKIEILEQKLRNKNHKMSKAVEKVLKEKKLKEQLYREELSQLRTLLNSYHLLSNSEEKNGYKKKKKGLNRVSYGKKLKKLKNEKNNLKKNLKKLQEIQTIGFMKSKCLLETDVVGLRKKLQFETKASKLWKNRYLRLKTLCLEKVVELKTELVNLRKKIMRENEGFFGKYTKILKELLKNNHSVNFLNKYFL